MTEPKHLQPSREAQLRDTLTVIAPRPCGCGTWLSCSCDKMLASVTLAAAATTARPVMPEPVDRVCNRLQRAVEGCCPDGHPCRRCAIDVKILKDCWNYYAPVSATRR